VRGVTRAAFAMGRGTDSGSVCAICNRCCVRTRAHPRMAWIYRNNVGIHAMRMGQ